MNAMAVPIDADRAVTQMRALDAIYIAAGVTPRP